MNINKLPFLLIVFILSSCSSSLKFDTKYCSSKARWTSDFDDKASYITVSKFGVGHQSVSLRKVLDHHKVSCKDLSTLSLRVRRDWPEAFLSAILGLSYYKLDIQVR